MPKFRKKPVVIEAVQLVPGCEQELMAHIGPTIPIRIGFDKKFFMVIPTLEGDHKAEEGDWIIKGMNGEFYPCKPDIFEKTYEAV